MKLMRRNTRRRKAACPHSWAQLLPSQMHSSVMVPVLNVILYLLELLGIGLRALYTLTHKPHTQPF